MQTRTDRNDRRRNRIRITDATRTGIFVERGERMITDALRRHFLDLPADQISTIEGLLGQLVARLAQQPRP